MPDERGPPAGLGAGDRREIDPSTWEEVFGREIADLHIDRVEAFSDLPLLDEISDGFATVAHHVFQQLDGSEGWPSVANGDIGSFFVRSQRQTAIVVQHQRRIAIGLFSGLGLRLLELAATAVGRCHVYDDAEFLDISPCEDDPHQPETTAYWRKQGVPAKRFQFASNLFLQMLEFIVLHELAHVDRGHLQDMERAGHLAFIDEAVAAGADRMRSREGRHKEFEADVWTVQLSRDDFLTRHGDDEHKVDSVLAQYRVAALAWLLTLMALDQKGLSLGEHALRTHPAPVHRAMLLDGALLEGLTAAFGIPEGDVRDMLDNVWVELAKVAEVAGMAKGRWWGETNRRMGLSSFSRAQREFMAYFNARSENWVSVLAGQE